MKQTSQPRRGFLTLSLAALALIGITPLIKKAAAQNAEPKKIKMLNAEGKLVEVDETVIAKLAADQERASKKELQEWMKTSQL